MNRYLLLLVSIGILSSASSCKLYRRMTGRSKPAVVTDSVKVTYQDSLVHPVDSAIVGKETTSVSVDTQGLALLSQLMPLWNKQTDWSTFNGKAKVHYEGKGENHDFTATIRMEKGSRIWVSVVALGLIEAARVLITPDTVRIMDRINKEVRIIPFSELGSLMPIRGDFAAIQSLIIGDVMQSGSQPNLAKDTAEALVVSYVSPDMTQSLQFDRKDSSLRFQAISATEAFLLCQYSDYTIEGGHTFANTRVLNMTDKGDPHALNMEFTRTGFNEPLEMPFTIPASYKKK